MTDLSEISEAEIGSLCEIWNKLQNNEEIGDRVTIVMEKLRDANEYLHDVLCRNIQVVLSNNPLGAQFAAMGACFILDVIQRHLELRKLEESLV